MRMLKGISLPVFEEGRQGTGYLKLKLFEFRKILKSDCYLLKFPEGSSIGEHVDPVSEGKHYRLNVVLKRPAVGGLLFCESPIFRLGERVCFFRPDVSKHSVSKIEKGSRWVFSLGFLR